MDNFIPVKSDKVVIFKIDNQEYGLSINIVREIVDFSQITKIPQCPPFILGIINLRGLVIPVIDPKKQFGIKESVSGTSSRMIVLEYKDVVTSMVIDSVSEVKKISEETIEPSPEIINGIDRQFIRGIVKLEDGKRVILLLNIDEIIKTKQKEKSKPSTMNSGKVLEKKVEKKIEEEKLVIFSVSREHYAFTINNIREIVRVPKLTKIPNSPNYVKGILTLRNSILPVFDFRDLINLGYLEDNPTEDKKILVIESDDMLAGLLVDHVDEVLNIDKSTIDTTSFSTNSTEIELKGIAKINNGEKLIFIMDEKLFFKEQQKKLIVKLNKQKESIAEKDKMTMSNDVAESKDNEKFVTFSVAEEVYGIKIMQIKEINRITTITRVPKSPLFIEGVINLRGEIIPLIDVRKKFEIESKEKDDRTRVLITDMSGRKTGLIVDKVNEVINIAKNQIEPSPDIVSSNMGAQFIEGVAKINDGKMVLLIDVNKILSDKEHQEYKNLSTKQNSVNKEPVEKKELKIEE